MLVCLFGSDTDAVDPCPVVRFVLGGDERHCNGSVTGTEFSPVMALVEPEFDEANRLRFSSGSAKRVFLTDFGGSCEVPRWFFIADVGGNKDLTGAWVASPERVSAV